MRRNLILLFTILLASTFSFAQSATDTTTTAAAKKKHTKSKTETSGADRDKLTPASGSSTASPTPATTAPASARTTTSRATGTSKTHSGDLIDLNSASESQLAALSGVGPAKAAKIVAMRPYAGKNQLVSKGILSADEYAAIKGQVIAHRVKQ